MTYLIIKAAPSGIIIMIVSEVSRRNPSVGGIIASLPLISILAFIWLWRDTSDSEIGNLDRSTHHFADAGYSARGRPQLPISPNRHRGGCHRRSHSPRYRQQLENLRDRALVPKSARFGGQKVVVIGITRLIWTWRDSCVGLFSDISPTPQRHFTSR